LNISICMINCFIWGWRWLGQFEIEWWWWWGGGIGEF